MAESKEGWEGRSQVLPFPNLCCQQGKEEVCTLNTLPRLKQCYHNTISIQITRLIVIAAANHILPSFCFHCFLHKRLLTAHVSIRAVHPQTTGHLTRICNPRQAVGSASAPRSMPGLPRDRCALLSLCANGCAKLHPPNEGEVWAEYGSTASRATSCWLRGGSPGGGGRAVLLSQV